MELREEALRLILNGQRKEFQAYTGVRVEGFRIEVKMHSARVAKLEASRRSN